MDKRTAKQKLESYQSVVTKGDIDWYRDFIQFRQLPSYERRRRAHEIAERLIGVPMRIIPDDDKYAYWELLDEVRGKPSKAINTNSYDSSLLTRLTTNIKKALHTKSAGYLYLKQWKLSNSNSWIKVGVTNDPNRRESEQNVLPVPSDTIKMIALKSMDEARRIERAIHEALSDRRVRGASNRELFELGENELESLVRAFAFLESISMPK